MNKLWTFGDSFTEGYNPKYEWSGKYIEWKGYRPKIYGDIIAEELGYELVNRGLGGSSNQTILERICESIDEIKSSDLVIVGWSSPIRIRLVDKQGYWQHIHPATLDKITKIGNVSPESISEILENRYHLKYCEEVNSWIKLINKSLTEGQIIHWKYHIERIDVHTITNKESIYEETKGLINDGHYSENGQKEVAEKLIEIFKSGNKRKLL